MKKVTIDISAKELRDKMGIKDGLPGKDGIQGIPGEKGADSIVPGPKGDKGDKGEDGSPDSPDEIRNKLELLQKEERLDISAIRGLDDYAELKKLAKKKGDNYTVYGAGGDKSLQQVTDVGATTTNVIEVAGLDVGTSAHVAVAGEAYFEDTNIILDGGTLSTVGETGFYKADGTIDNSTYLTAETDPLSLLLDQTTPQTVTGGTPIFGSGIAISSGTIDFSGSWIENGYLSEKTGGVASLDWVNRKLYAPNGTTVMADWSDTGGESMLATNRLINLLSPANTIDLTNGKLQQYAGVYVDSIDWANRKIYGTDGTTVVMDWAGTSVGFGMAPTSAAVGVNFGTAYVRLGDGTVTAGVFENGANSVYLADTINALTVTGNSVFNNNIQAAGIIINETSPVDNSNSFDVNGSGGFYNSNFGAKFADGSNLRAGYLFDGTNTVSLADGTYAVNAVGSSSFSANGGEYAATFTDSANTAILADAVITNSAGYFYNSSYSVVLADPLYAIYANGEVMIGGVLSSLDLRLYDADLGDYGSILLDASTYTFLGVSGGNAVVAANAANITSTVTANEVRTFVGTAGSPSFSFSTDTNTGMYRGGADILSFSTAGAERLRIDATGDVAIGSSTTVSRFAVHGTSTGSPSSTDAIFKVYGSATNALIFGTLTNSPFASYIQCGGSGTYPISLNPNGGFVGIATQAPTSTFTVSGSFAGAYRAITALRTLDATDYLINCTANSFTVTLPTAASITGRQYIIKNSGTGTITVATTSSQTIDGQLTQTLNQYDSLTVVSNGANWLVI